VLLVSIVTRPIINRRVHLSKPDQTDLFGTPTAAPEGFVYCEDLITSAEETTLIAELERLPFKPFEFQGYLGKRRIVSFGWKYNFDRKSLLSSDPVPDFLLPLRAKAAALAGIPAEDLQQILINEYEPGAGVGWHRDKGMFEHVIGISLASSCVFRFRHAKDNDWERVSHKLAPRSGYVMRGPSRWAWEHSVQPVKDLRYSITFRNFQNGQGATGF
jgi:alkylated DNA repair dioxygenase AlkB